MEARTIFSHIQYEKSDTTEDFVGSRGWFHRIKNGNNLRNVQSTLYPPELVFNFDETGLFWKRMPKRTFLFREEKRATWYKAAKDRLTLLLGGNANGYLKLKPLLIYHSKTPRAMQGIRKSTFPVLWEYNIKSWITMKIFHNPFTEHFCPSVKRYYDFKQRELKTLLLIDNAPSHPTHLSELTTCIPVEVVFLSPNTTSLIQPMDLGVISNFKAYFLRRTFRQLIDKTSILNVLRII